MVDVISEIGINHNGSIETAKKLIDGSSKAGADCVKFQTFFVEELARAHTPKSAFQLKRAPEESHIEMLSRCELSFEQHVELFNYCEEGF